jgi:hypothetical protein
MSSGASTPPSFRGDAKHRRRNPSFLIEFLDCFVAFAPRSFDGGRNCEERSNPKNNNLDCRASLAVNSSIKCCIFNLTLLYYKIFILIHLDFLYQNFQYLSSKKVLPLMGQLQFLYQHFYPLLR